MRVNLELYKTFYYVSKFKSMTLAAEELMVSQPAISKAIKTLENEIGGVLFNRSNKGLELTEEGRMLYTRIQPALDLITNAEIEFTQFKELNEGEINIGISSVLTKCILLDTLKGFKLKYPNIKINIINGLTCDLIEKMNRGKIDFVIFNESDFEGINAMITKLTELTYSFFYSETLGKVQVHSIEDLNKYPLILQQKESNTRKFLDKNSRNILEPQMEVISQDLILSLVNCGLGIGFAFDKIIKNDFIKIKLDEIPKTEILLATNKTKTLSFAAKKFIESLQKNL